MPVVAGSFFAEAAYSYNGQGLTVQITIVHTLQT